MTVCGCGVFAAERGKRSNPSLVGYPKGKRAEVASAEPSRVLRQRLPAVPASVRAARIAATGFAKSHGATDERLLSDIALCVSEVASNVVVHAYPDTRGEISLTIRQTRADLVVEISDQGADAAGRTLPRALGSDWASSTPSQMQRPTITTRKATTSPCDSGCIPTRTPHKRSVNLVGLPERSP